MNYHREIYDINFDEIPDIEVEDIEVEDVDPDAEIVIGTYPAPRQEGLLRRAIRSLFPENS